MIANRNDEIFDHFELQHQPTTTDNEDSTFDVSGGKGKFMSRYFRRLGHGAVAVANVVAASRFHNDESFPGASTYIIGSPLPKVKSRIEKSQKLFSDALAHVSTQCYHECNVTAQPAPER